eukprot:jgi/Chrzof1/7356/Cz02g20240.t1
MSATMSWEFKIKGSVCEASPSSGGKRSSICASCVYCGLLKYGLYSVRPALPESRSFQMVLEAPRCFQMFLDVSKCVQKFLEPESHRGPTLKHRPQHRAEDTESPERLRQQISIKSRVELQSLCILNVLLLKEMAGYCKQYACHLIAVKACKVR